MDDIKVYIFGMLPGTIYIETGSHKLTPTDKENYIAMETTNNIDKDLINIAIKNNQLELTSKLTQLPFADNDLMKVVLIENNLMEDKEGLIDKLKSKNYNNSHEYNEYGEI